MSSDSGSPHDLTSFEHSDLSPIAVQELALTLNAIVADLFALYVKTKGFHWHVSGPHFRDYYALLNEQAGQLHVAIDPLAERIRKLGATTIASVSDIATVTRFAESARSVVTANDMFTDLRKDNLDLVAFLREAHALCDEYGDSATAGFIETWIDEAEGRIWQLHELSQPNDNQLSTR